MRMSLGTFAGCSVETSLAAIFALIAQRDHLAVQLVLRANVAAHCSIIDVRIEGLGSLRSAHPSLCPKRVPS
jgi:hypothetical protein